MAIPESFIDEVVARSDILDIVSRYVPLKKSGSNHFGLCPFHNEKSPSFSVSRDKQIYHCFGCGAGGGVINFIMRIENLSFVEAIANLAEQAGMKMPEDTFEGDARRKRRERLIKLSADAARFFVAQLYSPVGEPARKYLLGRGFSVGILKHFGVGFAPESWDGLLKAMGELGYTKSELLECGLAVQNSNGGIYDRFRNRVMFPIIDIRGNVIAFGGRVMDDSTPKYLNSSDTPIFSKSNNLYAMNFAKTSKRKIFILAEGYMDVMALHQYGFDSAVASLGTALTAEQCRLMSSRGKEEVVICYDSDEAGKKAASRAIELLSKTDLRVRVLHVTGAKDPDEFIKKNGADAFEKLLTGASGDIEYQLATMKSQCDMDSNEGKVEYLQKAAKFLATIQSDVKREIYGTNVAKDVEIAPQAMTAEIERARKNQNRTESEKIKKAAVQPVKTAQPQSRELRYTNIRSATSEERVVALLLVHEELVGATNLTPDEFSSPFLRKVYEDILKRHDNGLEISLACALTELNADESDLLVKIAAISIGTEDLKTQLEDCASVIKEEHSKNINNEEDPFEVAKRRLARDSRRGN